MLLLAIIFYALFPYAVARLVCFAFNNKLWAFVTAVAIPILFAIVVRFFLLDIDFLGLDYFTNFHDEYVPHLSSYLLFVMFGFAGLGFIVHHPFRWDQSNKKQRPVFYFASLVALALAWSVTMINALDYRIAILLRNCNFLGYEYEQGVFQIQPNYERCREVLHGIPPFKPSPRK